ncbi:hypothetical protein AB0D29_32850 [Streptomyces sp. NPDC048424]|uniref:hypothetical protein n=1 Tax=Streptomyces sp. NPDC048424 TaxID=3155265 RepID=UPI003426AC14
MNCCSVAATPKYDDRYDDYGVEVTGYPAGWSVAAARAAITPNDLRAPGGSRPSPVTSR